MTLSAEKFNAKAACVKAWPVADKKLAPLDSHLVDIIVFT
jgi:hypothetical protein